MPRGDFSFTRLDQTFHSRAQTEVVLRPYLEEGRITAHDYNLAVSFLPGNGKYWPIAYGAGLTGLTVGYGQYWRTPKWTPRRTMNLGFVACVAGLLFGQVKRISAHVQFVKALENPQGFVDAIREVMDDEPVNVTVPQHRSFSRNGTAEEDGNGFASNEGDAAWTTDPIQSSPSAAVEASSIRTGTTRSSKSRWDELRSANARNAKQSSWDVLRQGHEKAQATDNIQSSQIPSITNDADAERTREQARFDAMLEAERRIAGG